MCDGVSKNVDFSQRRKGNMEDRWEDGWKEGNMTQMHDYLLQKQVKKLLFSQLMHSSNPSKSVSASSSLSHK